MKFAGILIQVSRNRIAFLIQVNDPLKIIKEGNKADFGNYSTYEKVVIEE